MLDPTISAAQHDGFSVKTAPVLIMGDNREHSFRVGYAMTTHGVVGVYDQQNPPRTSMDFVLRGRCHRVSWERTFSDRFLKTLATRLALAVARERSETVAATGLEADPGCKTEPSNG